MTDFKKILAEEKKKLHSKLKELKKQKDAIEKQEEECNVELTAIAMYERAKGKKEITRKGAKKKVTRIKKPTRKINVLSLIEVHNNGVARKEIIEGIGLSQKDGQSVSNALSDLIREGIIVSKDGKYYVAK